MEDYQKKTNRVYEPGIHYQLFNIYHSEQFNYLLLDTIYYRQKMSIYNENEVAPVLAKLT